MQKIYSIIMTKSVLQEFFDEFDKDRDPNLPPRLVGITNYLFDLGKTSSVVFQRTAIIENPLRGFGFSEIDSLYQTRDDIYIVVKKMIFTLVNRVRLEKERNPFVLFNVDTVRNFLELMLIYFGSNRNISGLERNLLGVYEELLCFLVFGKTREIADIAEESSIIRLDDFNDKIDDIFNRLGDLVLLFYLCSVRIKNLR